MKKFLLLLGLSLALNLAYSQQAFEVMTKAPTPGSVIAIEYMPRNTVLQGVKDFEATAYLLEGALPRAVEVPLKGEGGVYRGSVKTADSTRAVFFSFAKDEKRDNNNDEGYYTVLYDKGRAVVPGAKSAAAMALGSYGGIWGMKRNAAKATALNKEEFANAASREKFANDYLATLAQSKDSDDKAMLKTELAKRLSRKDLTEIDLLGMKGVYEYTLKDKEGAATVAMQLNERYPNGRWKIAEASNKFYRLKTLAEKEQLYLAEVAPFAPFRKDEEMVAGSMAANIGRLYADSGNYAAAKKYFNQVPGNSSKASNLNNIAWKLSGESLLKKPKDVKLGLELSSQSLALIEEEKKTLRSKPAYLIGKQYRQELEGSYYMYSDTYATLLYHDGQYQKAYDLEAAAVAHNKRKDVSMNEAYAILTEKVRGKQAAQLELEKFYADGKYTPAMKEQLKSLYISGGKNEAEWTAYASNLEQAAYNKLKEEVAKKMINLPAPQFALKNMKGEKVELASLKGKVVVVDFWATWCGPCIASFPGMQTAVNKFKDNPAVQFLFIDTWENDSNRVQKVTDFIATNKYSFNVLYDDVKADETFTVVSDFKVEGIPTKFVIDPAGNIRFKSVGFSGSADAVVQELTAMIDMAGGGTTEKKGF